jgi:hypothetical protein
MHPVRKLPLALALLAAAAAPAGPGAAPAAPQSPSVLNDLAWLAGTWRHEDEAGNLEEETWSAPRADALIGMFRMAQRGRVTLFELMSIELEGAPGAGHDGPLIPGQDAGAAAGGAPQRLVLRLRHFHRGLAPWEAEKDGPMRYEVKSLEPNAIVFEDAQREFPRQVVYRRNGDSLHVRLVSATPARQDLAFELKKAAD